jgi:hypothetical protein
MSRRIFIVETISQHRCTFAVEAESANEAMNIAEADDYQREFGQSWLGQVVLGAHPVSEDDYIAAFDQITDYLKDQPRERKLSYIMRSEQKPDNG